MPSTITFRGDAGKIAAISSVQITGYDVATTYSLFINNKVVSVLGQGGTVATTAAALKAAATASSFPEFNELTFTVSTDTITWTHKTPGNTFNVTKGVTGGAGTMGSVTNSIANSGPNDLAVAANYSGGALPSAGDTLIFENLRSGSDVKFNLNALSAIALAKVIFRNCAVDFGLPAINPLGYFEYRDQYLQLNAAIIEFDCPDCQLARIDSGSAVVAITCRATGTTKVSGVRTLLWKGTHASNVCYFDRGSIGVAVLSGETAVIATLNCGYISQSQSDSNVQIGSTASSITLGTVNRTGGSLDLYCGTTGIVTSKEGAGVMRIFGSGTQTNLKTYAGKIEYYGNGTITNMTIGPSIIFDATLDEYAFEVTNVVQGYQNGAFLDPFKRATGPAAGTFLGCKANGCKSYEFKLDRGQDCTLQAA